MLGNIEDALVNEADQAAAIEELSALLHLYNPEPWDKVLPFLFCLSPSILDATLPLLARSSDAIPLYFLSGLSSLPVRDGTRARYFYVATSGDPASLATALRYARIEGDEVAARVIESISAALGSEALLASLWLATEEMDEFRTAEALRLRVTAVPVRVQARHYPPGLVEDIMRVTECQFAFAGELFFANVMVGLSQQPIHLLESNLPRNAGCRFAVLARIVALRLGAWMPPNVNVAIFDSLDPSARDRLLQQGDVPDEESVVVSPEPRSSREVASGEMAEPLRVGGDVMAPAIIAQAQPRYPEKAKAERVQGVVILEAIISEVGKIEDVKILRGHPLLHEAAIEAIRKWRFLPGKLEGRPVRVYFTLTVNFTLK